MAQLQRLAIAPSQISAESVILTPDQQHYLRRVLRLQPGDRFISLTGGGQWQLAVLADEPSRATLLETIPMQNELATAITLLMALPKTGMDDVVRQTTELGVAHIQPVISDRTLLRPSAQKLDRWRRIAQEAAEQAERQIIPDIYDPLPFTQALHQTRAVSASYVCTARGLSEPLLQRLIAPLPPVLAIATGPEGGWTPSEVAEAIAAGFQPVSLGRRILRATTAPVAALAILSAVLET